MAECCHHKSPLAMDILSGKYFSPNGDPTDARLNLFKEKYSEGESRYNLSNTILKAATKGKNHNPSTEKMSNADTIDLEDCHRIDPAPNSRATINSGPNEHGTPLM